MRKFSVIDIFLDAGKVFAFAIVFIVESFVNIFYNHR